MTTAADRWASIVRNEATTELFTELAAIGMDRDLTPAQRLIRRVRAAIASEPDAAEIGEQLRRVLEQAS